MAVTRLKGNVPLNQAENKPIHTQASCQHTSVGVTRTNPRDDGLQKKKSNTHTRKRNPSSP